MRMISVIALHVKSAIPLENVTRKIWRVRSAPDCFLLVACDVGMSYGDVYNKSAVVGSSLCQRASLLKPSFS